MQLARKDRRILDDCSPRRAGREGGGRRDFCFLRLVACCLIPFPTVQRGQAGAPAQLPLGSGARLDCGTTGMAVRRAPLGPTIGTEKES